MSINNIINTKSIFLDVIISHQYKNHNIKKSNHNEKYEKVYHYNRMLNAIIKHLGARESAEKTTK